MSALEPRRRGRPPGLPRELVLRIIDMHNQGLSLRAISQVLNREGIPTPAGRTRWHKSMVDRVLHTRYVQDLVNEVGKQHAAA